MAINVIEIFCINVNLPLIAVPERKVAGVSLTEGFKPTINLYAA